MNIDDRITSWLADLDGDIVIPIEAHKLVAGLRESEPEALAEWLDARAEAVVSDRMRQLLVASKTRHRRRGPQTAFTEAAEAFAEGDPGPLALLDVRYIVDDEHTRRRLRDMTREDLTFAAGEYDTRAASNALEAAYLRAIAKRVTKGRVVGDVFSDDQLSALREAAA